jgi:hypothetical protein
MNLTTLQALYNRAPELSWEELDAVEEAIGRLRVAEAMELAAALGCLAWTKAEAAFEIRQELARRKAAADPAAAGAYLEQAIRGLDAARSRRQAADTLRKIDDAFETLPRLAFAVWCRENLGYAVSGLQKGEMRNRARKHVKAPVGANP